MVTGQCSILGGHTVLTVPCREFPETSAKEAQREKMELWFDSLLVSCLHDVSNVGKKRKNLHPFIHLVLGFLRSAVIQMTVTSLAV